MAGSGSSCQRARIAVHRAQRRDRRRQTGPNAMQGWLRHTAWLGLVVALSVAPPVAAHAAKKPRVQVLAFAQGGCNPQAVRATAKKLRGAITRCVAQATGKHTWTMASSKTGKATQLKGRGEFAPEVVRCIEARVEAATWPKSAFCDMEMTVVAN